MTSWEYWSLKAHLARAKQATSDIPATSRRAQTSFRGMRTIGAMRKAGKGTLYLIEPEPFSFWLVSYRELRIPVHVKRSRHNFAGVRYDFWFSLPFDAWEWHGYQIGENNQIAHCRRTKRLLCEPEIMAMAIRRLERMASAG